jgi:hypothetical protein
MSTMANRRAVCRTLSRWVVASWRLISQLVERRSGHQIAASVWSAVRTVLVAEPACLISLTSRP